MGIFRATANQSREREKRSVRPVVVDQPPRRSEETGLSVCARARRVLHKWNSSAARTSAGPYASNAEDSYVYFVRVQRVAKVPACRPKYFHAQRMFYEFGFLDTRRPTVVFSRFNFFDVSIFRSIQSSPISWTISKFRGVLYVPVCDIDCKWVMACTGTKLECTRRRNCCGGDPRAV